MFRAKAKFAERWKPSAPAIVCMAAMGLLLVGLFTWGQYPRMVYCNVLLPLRFTVPSGEGFLSDSNIEQRLFPDSFDNIAEEEGEQPGWKKLVLKDPSKTGSFEAELRYVRDAVIIYPRVASGGSVIAYTPYLNGRKRLASLAGGSSWTNIGGRYLLTLSCAENAWDAMDFPLRIQFVLIGKNAQVWLKNQQVFF